MLKKILWELVLIRKELQVIRHNMEPLSEKESTLRAFTARSDDQSKATYVG